MVPNHYHFGKAAVNIALNHLFCKFAGLCIARMMGHLAPIPLTGYARRGKRLGHLLSYGIEHNPILSATEVNHFQCFLEDIGIEGTA